MIQVRHKLCGARLFDSAFPVENLSGSPAPDISVKCPRCSREQKTVVLTSFRLKVPKHDAPIVPEPIRCVNLNCLNRLMDLALEYSLVDHPSHLEIVCGKCGELNHVSLSGIVLVENVSS